jgi:predicted RNA-binding protein with PIN domain
MEEFLIVDGYNIIGASQSMHQFDGEELEKARDWLIDVMADYQGFTGTKVYIIFDAHKVPGIGKKYLDKRLNIYYTKENETADERIERLVKQLKRIQRRIYVATSDHTEQWVVFGQGALRKSARELLIELEQMKRGIQQKLEEGHTKKRTSSFELNPELREMFEKWRRGK